MSFDTRWTEGSLSVYELTYPSAIKVARAAMEIFFTNHSNSYIAMEHMIFFANGLGSYSVSIMMMMIFFCR